MPRAAQEDCANLPLIDVTCLLRADPYPPAQRDYLRVAEVEAKVFSEEGLVKSDVRERFAADPEHFRVDIGELTTEGWEFARSDYQRWIANMGRWKGERTAEKIEASLRKALIRFRARTA